MKSFPISAELAGSNECCTEGHVAQGASPVLALCRKLIDAGFDPYSPLEAYRDAILALRVRSIGEAAGVEINSAGTGFVRHRAVRTALLVRKTEGGRHSGTRPPQKPVAAAERGALS